MINFFLKPFLLGMLMLLLSPLIILLLLLGAPFAICWMMGCEMLNPPSDGWRGH